MRYGSVCSGIEAASIAWEPLGFTPLWFSEIEAFPSAVLANHWPNVTNLGDMTKIADKVKLGSAVAPDILVGGTPCQAFSVAGLRNGLDDERGQLTLSYVELANEIDKKRIEQNKPESIIVWENVPGVLSDKSNAFGCFLAGLAGEDDSLQPAGKKWTNSGCVYGPQRAIAWRTLDAQYFGVAQRRRRVFVVASARKDIDPTKILFEFEGMRRDSPPCKNSQQTVGTFIASSFGICGETADQAVAGHVVTGSHWDGMYNPHPTLNQSSNAGGIGLSNQELFSQRGGGLVKWPADIVSTLNASFGSKLGLENQHIDGGASLFVPDISHTLLGKNNSSHAADLDTYVVHGSQDPCVNINLANPVARNNGLENVACIASNIIGRSDNAGGNGVGVQDELSYTLDTCNHPHSIAHSLGVRRLTPIECERLQGFPDNHTQVPYRNKSINQCPDGQRYKAIGNSMAVPVMKWIGERIKLAVNEGHMTNDEFNGVGDGN